ncbi:MAG: flippase [Candidatus Liptonbacteria bacterium]|nr:flippase [Candidatus Liptonbacteria bacterium]
MHIKDFIFEPKTGGQRIGRRIFRNAFWLTFGDVLNRVLKLALVAVMTRVLPVAEFGAFTFTLNLLGLTFILADLGISNVLQRRLAAEDDRTYLSTTFAMKLGLLVLAGVVSRIAAGVSDPAVAALASVLIFMMALDVLKNFFLVIHTAKNRMDKVAIANNAETAVIVLLGFLVLTNVPSVIALAWVYVLGALAAFSYVAWTVRRELLGLFSFINVRLMKTVAWAGWPLALGGMVWGLMSTTDSLILGWLTNLELAAFYNAAAKIPQFLGPIGGIVVGATFPSLVATIKNHELHKKLFERINEILFALTIPIAAGGLLVAEPIIRTLYGDAYLPSAFVLIFLLFNLVQTAINFFLTQLIFAHDHQSQSLLYVSLAWLTNIALSVILIPIYGMGGAVGATILGQGLIFISHTHFVKRKYGLVVLTKEVAKPAFAAAMMYVILLAFGAGRRSIFITIPAGAILYGIILIALKPNLLHDIKSLFRGEKPRIAPETGNL